MADILKPVDPEELKLIEQEPYEQRDLSVRRAVQFLVVIFFTIIGLADYLVLCILVGAAEPARRFAVGAPRSAPASAAPPNRVCRASPCATGRPSSPRRRAKPPPTSSSTRPQARRVSPSNARRNLFWSGGCNRYRRTIVMRYEYGLWNGLEGWRLGAVAALTLAEPYASLPAQLYRGPRRRNRRGCRPQGVRSDHQSGRHRAEAGNSTSAGADLQGRDG
jgi:hypothetical protein